jgi:hypothetical protein
VNKGKRKGRGHLSPSPSHRSLLLGGGRYEAPLILASISRTSVSRFLLRRS